MIDKFNEDILNLEKVIDEFWSIDCEIVYYILGKMRYDLIYGEYLAFHGIKFISVENYASYIHINVVVRKTFFTSSLHNLHKLIFSKKLLRLYNLNKIISNE